MDRSHRSLKSPASATSNPATPPSIDVQIQAEHETGWTLTNDTMGLKWNWPKKASHPALELGTTWKLTLLPPEIKPSQEDHLSSLRQLLQELIR